jgi:hypothetical protein
MAVLKEMFKEERDRLIKIRKFYRDKILELPRGSVVFKTRGIKKYPYLVYREKNKIKTDYLKLNLDELEKLQLDISKRRKYLKLLREIEKDLRSFGNNMYE